MKTVREIREDQTAFILSDLEPIYHQAARDLYYTPVDNGFAKSFPTNTPDLDRIYRNFERYADAMLRQTAGQQPVPWEQALRAFLLLVEGQDIFWFLGGSAALAVRGVEVQPRDLDILTDAAGAQRLDALLRDWLVEPVTSTETWVARWFGRAFLHARLEWAGEVQAWVDEPEASDFGPTAARRLETVTWDGYPVLVPPLDLQLRVSERRGLHERAEKIKRILNGGG